jgi:threonine dehydratase
MTLDAGALTLAEVERAQARLRPHLAPTPLRRCPWLGDQRAFLKLECWQPTGSFKVRGALNRLATLEPARRARGVVAASAGNHALGVAFAVEALGGGTSATLYVPHGAPAAKLSKLRRFPVELRLHGATYDDAYAEAHREAERRGAFYLHAYDDPMTAAGQGTIALELLAALPELGTLLVPVAGGGLIAGIGVALKALRPQARLVAVQPEASPALRESLRLGRPLLDYPAGPTLADGLAGGIGEIVFAHRACIDEVVTVSEREIEEAIVALVLEEQVVAEGSGAVGVAALRSGRLGPLPAPVVAVVSGANLDAGVLGRLLAAHA